MQDGPFREDLRRDITEAYLSLNDGRWKAATVLSGSAIEALLVWRLGQSQTLAASIAKSIPNSKPQPNGSPDGWPLWRLIAVAAVDVPLTTDCVKLLDVSRNYRNLIHPGKTVRTGERCGKDTALGALAALERVILEVKA